MGGCGGSAKKATPQKMSTSPKQVAKTFTRKTNWSVGNGPKVKFSFTGKKG